MTLSKNQIVAAGGGALLLLLMATAGRQAGDMMARLSAIITMTGLGFGLGWFLSPQAKALRQTALLALGALLLIAAVGTKGVLGWSLTSLVATIGFCVALGYWIGAAVRSFRERPTTFGSAEWASLSYLEDHGIVGQSGIRLGHFASDDRIAPLHYDGDRHLLTIAPTRSGKGTTAIIPNLLSYTGSALVIDPKGENAMITSAARARMGQDIFIVDPWMIASADHKPARFNPLDWLVKGDIDITENAMLLADALVVNDGKGDAFWVEEAKALMQGLILFVATDEEERQHRHLGRVRDLLLLDGEDMPALFHRMSQSAHHVVASTGARCLQKDEKLLSSVLSSAQAQTHFLDSARIRDSLSSSDFKFEDLKTKAMTIYLVLPSDRLNTFGRWLRLLIQQAITVNARNIDIIPAKPILFLLDEMPALGRLTMVEQGFGLMAGFGLQLWGIVQDAGQLKRDYGDAWETFIGNSGVIQYFGSRDRMTAEYFSALCGETTVWNFSTAIARAFGTSSGAGGAGSSQSTTTTDTAAAQRKLAYPDELMRMHRKKQLVFVENHHPILGIKTRWFDDDEFKLIGRNLRKGSVH